MTFLYQRFRGKDFFTQNAAQESIHEHLADRVVVLFDCGADVQHIVRSALHESSDGHTRYGCCRHGCSLCRNVRVHCSTHHTCSHRHQEQTCPERMRVSRDGISA